MLIYKLSYLTNLIHLSSSIYLFIYLFIYLINIYIKNNIVQLTHSFFSTYAVPLFYILQRPALRVHQTLGQTSSLFPTQK